MNPPHPSAFSDLPKRIGTAILLIGISVAAKRGGPVTWGIFLCLALVGMWYEWYHLTGWSSAWRIGGLLYLPLPCMAAFVFGYAVQNEIYVLKSFFCLEPCTRDTYIVLSGSARADPFPIGTTTFLAANIFPFLVVPLVDVFAYFRGRLIGGPKVAPSISPQ